MPLLETIQGLKIYVRFEKGGKHKKYHIHVEYKHKKASIDLDGNVLAGKDNIPKKQLKLVEQYLKDNKASIIKIIEEQR